jgi:prevent-host-death family protein
MTTSIPLSQLKQRTGAILNQAVTQQQDVIIERYGQEYAVIMSVERYQSLVDAAEARVRERFLKAQQEVYQATSNIPAAEIDALIAQSIEESRQQRAGLDDESNS